jgi:hypothetical protein
MAHQWWHPITTAIGNVATSIGQGLMSDAGRAVMGASGLALVNKAYQDLEDVGERAFTGVDPIAAAGLQQTAFRPFTVSVGSRAFPGSRYASSSIGVGIPAPSSFETMGREDRIQQLMAQNPDLTREQAIANQDFSRMQGFDINSDGVVTNQEYRAAMQAGVVGGGAGGAGGAFTGGMAGGIGPNLQIDLSEQEQRIKQKLLESARQGLLTQQPAGAAAMRTAGTRALTRGEELLKGVSTGIDPAAREQEVYDRIRATQVGEEERQRLALEERLASQGRLGVQTAMFGGTPEQLALAKAQESAQNQASLMAMQQAQQERLQQAALAEQVLGLGSGLFSGQLGMQQVQQGMGLSDLAAAYIPQAQALNMFQQGLAASELAQRGQLAGASMFGEAKMSGLDALLASGLGRANLIGAAGTGLLGGAIG